MRCCRYLDDDDGSSAEDEDEMDLRLYAMYIYRRDSRYISRINYRDAHSNYWKRYINPTITYDDEFKLLFRMTRSNFEELLLLIRNHTVFSVGATGRPQKPIVLQLMIFLYYLGMSGDGAKFEIVGQKFHVSKGTVRSSFNRVLMAVLSLKDDFIKWPTAEERELIGTTHLGLCGFPRCVGAIDGTYICLAQRPTWCGHDFFTRKSTYAVQALIICDHDARINYVYSGWPGCVHDNRVWRNCDVYKNPEQYFSPGEYLLSDSALNPSMYIVPAFKALPKVPLSENQQFFNRQLAKGRIRIEHVNGLLKSRFPILKCMNVKIEREIDVLKVLRILMACCILHNFLLSDPFLPEEDIRRLFVGAVDKDEPEVFGEVNLNHSDPESRRKSIYDFIMEYYKRVNR